MGMIEQCKCDSCGEIVNCNKDLNGKAHCPPDWHIVHWQKKNTNQTGGGYENVKLFYYCALCGESRLKDMTKRAES